MQSQLVAVLTAAALAAGTHAARAQTAPPAPTPSDKPAVDTKVNLWGFGQFEYRRATAGAPALTPEHELHLRRARFVMAGKVTQQVSYVFSVQGNGVSDNRVLDFYVDLATRPWLKFRVGQGKYEFDIEGREAVHGNPFMDRAHVTNAVAGSLNGASSATNAASSFRDRGVTILATPRSGSIAWSFGAGAYQGAGLASDNNSRMSFAANVNAESHGFKLSAGYLDSPSASQGTPASKYTAWTVGAAYDKAPWLLRGEFYSGRRERPTGDQEVSGFYVLGGATLRGRLDLTARYQQVTDTRFPKGDDRLSSVDLQARYFFDRRDKRSGTSLTAGVALREADRGVQGVHLFGDGRGAVLGSGDAVDTVLLARLQVRF